MNRSDEISDLAKALVKAQSVMTGAKKDAKNTIAKGTSVMYATLESAIDAVRKPLADNGLVIVQMVGTDSPQIVTVETMLAHESGQWISSIASIPTSKADAQGHGSAITYLRRYSLMAMCGIAPEDDDGKGASGDGPSASPDTKPQPQRTPAPEPMRLPKHLGGMPITQAPEDALNAWDNAAQDGLDKEPGNARAQAVVDAVIAEFARRKR